MQSELSGGQASVGTMHVHNGTGGFAFVTKTGLVNVSQTIIPDGTGDVTGGLSGFLVLNDGVGAVTNAFTMLPGDNLDVVAGGFTMRLALSAGGALTAIRQAGAGTATLTIFIVWMWGEAWQTNCRL